MRSTALSLPVLQGVLLNAGNGSLTASTFDYETSAQQSILAAGGSGHALVPARLLNDMLHVIPRGVDLRLTITSGKHSESRLRLSAGDDLDMELPTLPVEEWPAPPEIGEQLFVMPGERLAYLARGAIAAGRDDSLPILTCTHVETVDDKIVAASTDRYRLAVAEVPGHFPARLGPLNIPSRVMERMGKALAKEPEVEVYLNRDPSGRGGSDDVLTFVGGSRVFHARLYDGEFPRYRALMDVPQVARANIPSASLAEAIRQAAVVVRSAPVTAEWLGEGVVEVAGGVHADDTGEASVRRKVREVEWEGDRLRVAFNARYVTAGLAALGGEKVTCRFGGEHKPVLLTNPDDPGFSYLVMPVRLAT
jgi:DNA polymerase-3 subunit beta